jgi:hypothetical protein
MKKIFAILVVCIVAGFIYHFVQSRNVAETPAPKLPNAAQAITQQRPTEQEQLSNSPAEKPATVSPTPSAVAAAPLATGTPVLVGSAPRESGSKPITHTATDFVKGEFDNIVLNDALHLGNDTTPTTFQSKYKLYGLFHSLPEDLPTTFNKVIPSYQGTIPEGGELGFWIRTRTADGIWSTWTEVGTEHLNQPIMLERPATSWQYRLTFFANDTVSSPRITGVTVGTEVPPLADNVPDDDPGRRPAK